jgi:hypothetical protein
MFATINNDEPQNCLAELRLITKYKIIRDENSYGWGKIYFFLQ